MLKELTCAAFIKITKDVWTKAEEHVVKMEGGIVFSHETFDLRSY
jgi:hypothetical protein